MDFLLTSEVFLFNFSVMMKARKIGEICLRNFFVFVTGNAAINVYLIFYIFDFSGELRAVEKERKKHSGKINTFCMGEKRASEREKLDIFVMEFCTVFLPLFAALKTE